MNQDTRLETWGLGQPILWPDPRLGPWWVALKWVKIGSSVECVGVELWNGVHPAEDTASSPGIEVQLLDGCQPGPIGTTELRKLPLSALIEDRRRSATTLFRALGDAVAPASLEEERRYRRGADMVEQKKSHLGRPRQYDDSHYAEVASVYSEAWQQGADPTSTVARKWVVNKSTAAKWVRKCRDLKLLPETRRGVARATAVQRGRSRRRSVDRKRGHSQGAE